MAEDEKEKVQMFDDDSKAFKLLWHEIKDVKNVVVHDIRDAVVQDFKDTDEYLLNAFTKASDKINTYLHYTSDDLRKDNEAKRRAIEKVERVGFKNKVVLPMEGMDDKTVEARYHKLPGDAEKCEICGKNRDIKLTGKPEAIAIDEPDVPKGLDDNDNYIARRDDDQTKTTKKKNRFGISL